MTIDSDDLGRHWVRSIHHQQFPIVVSITKQQGRTSLPILQGILPIDPTHLQRDLAAGVVLAALGIPEVMGYTKISNTPIATGLYTLLLPVVAFAIFGSSRHLVVAADSATAAIIAAELAPLANGDPARYLALARLVAIVTAGLLLITRLFRLGFLADFLSRTVLIGFLTGVGIQVAIGQLGELLGIVDGHGNAIERLVFVATHLAQIHLPTAIVAIAVLVVLFGFERLLPKFPGALVAVIGAILASWLLNFGERGISIVGTVPTGLPSLGLPAVSLGEIPAVLGIAFSCGIVIVAQSAATSRAYAFRYRDRFDPNLDLLGLAAANLLAGASGTFVVNGSPTKTAIVDTAGGRSQISQLTTAAIVVIVILFFAAPIGYLPNAALAAIVLTIGLKLIDLRGMHDIWKTHREEFYLAAFAAITVVFIGVKEGIITAAILSLILHVYHSYRPHSAVLIPQANRSWEPIPARAGAISAPGLIIYRFSRDLFYANTTYFAEQIKNLVYTAPSDLRWFILEARAITEIDYSAAQTLRDVVKDLSRRDIVFSISGLSPEVKAQFDRDGLTELIGSDRLFDRLEDALARFDIS